MGVKKYTWKDIVLINGETYPEEFEISGRVDGDIGELFYQIDDYYEAVANKYNVDTSDILTYMMDDIDFNPEEMPWGAAECGCYIDGVAEWTLSTDSATNPVYEAYKTLLNAYESGDDTYLIYAVEEAIGFLGQALE